MALKPTRAYTWKVVDVRPQEAKVGIMWDNNKDEVHYFDFPLDNAGNLITGQAFNDWVNSVFPYDWKEKKDRVGQLAEAQVQTLLNKTGSAVYDPNV